MAQNKGPVTFYVIFDDLKLTHSHIDHEGDLLCVPVGWYKKEFE